MPGPKLRKWLMAPLEFANDVRIVAAWDVVRQARRPFFFFSRMMLAGLVSFQVLWMWSTMFRSRDEATQDGAFEITPSVVVQLIQTIYQSSNFIVAVGLILLCPVLTAGCVAGDRERKIWYDLANSPLSGWSIVLGKMVARLATIVAWILVVLPIWAILGLLGGLDPRQVVTSFTAFFFYGWFYAGIGLLASVLTSRTRDALGLATSMVIFILIFPTLDDLIVGTFFGFSATNAIEIYFKSFVIFNPVVTISYELSNWSSLTRFSIFTSNKIAIWTVILSGPILTFISGLLLRPVSRRLESRAVKKEGRRETQMQLTDRPDAFARSDGDTFLARTWFSPLAIKERKIRSGSRLGRFLKTFLLMIGLVIGGYYLVTMSLSSLFEVYDHGYSSGVQTRRQELMALAMAISGLIHPLLIFTLMLDPAARILAEKESDTWLTLLSTPVEAVEILSSKVFGALWSWRVVIGFLLVTWAVGLACGAIGIFGLMLAVVVWFVQGLLCLALGLRFGLTSQSFQSAALKCVGAWLVLEFFIPFFAIFILKNTTAGVQPSVIAVGVLAIHEANINEPAMPGILSMGTLLTFIHFFCAIGLLGWANRNFGRLNGLTLDGPEQGRTRY